NLGVIVVDEEQDQAYKQIELEPHYNGRDSAVYRAFLSGCVCILSSATPAMESMYNAVTGKYKLLEMQFRVEGRALPDKKIVDMRDVKNRGRNFSRELEEEIKKRLSEKEQILLFLNRRGFSRVLQCRKCGFVFECENCSVSLVYHLETHSLNCHYCEYMRKLPEECPECHSVDLKFIGSGTEKIQEEIKEMFPDARIGRLDRDIAIKRKKFQKVLADFKSHKIDILIGTQLIAKGLDFLNVTLVGVINSDILISFPDYRALEQAFQLLTQVSGRAGRGEKRGEVLIQTYQPDNEAIQYAIKNSYNDFFEFELPKREELSYPPFSHLIKFLFKAVSKDNARKYAYLYMNELVKIKDKYGFTLLGPAPGLIERIKNKYRWLLVVRSKKRGLLIRVIKSIHQRLKPLAGRHKVSVDLIVDPYDLV
ncbi:primosomal protein N', partial [Candidatus Dependentiae bacterium]|nr:primosomal protein N' [Candidatus Dependentiae bacterium]